MKILNAIVNLGGKLLKGVPGSGIVTEFKNIKDSKKPDTWVHFACYALGVAALWLGLYYGIIEEGTFLKFVKAIF